MKGIENKILNGEVCCLCCTDLKPNEVIFIENDESGEFMADKMPASGGIGVIVYCELCRMDA